MTAPTEIETQVLVKAAAESEFFSSDMDLDKDALKFRKRDLIRAALSAFTLGIATTGWTRLSFVHFLFSIPGFFVMVSLIASIAVEKTIIGVVVVVLFIHVMNCAAYSYRLLILQRMGVQRDILYKIKNKLKEDNEADAEISLAVVYCFKKLYVDQRHNPNFKWTLLSPDYEKNLNNFWKTFVDKKDKVDRSMVCNALKSAFDIDPTQNGFDLFYTLTLPDKKKQKFVRGLIVLSIIFGIVLLVFTELDLTRLISDNYFGVIMRIALIQVVLSMLIISALSVFFNPISAISAIRKSSTWINIGGLYRSPKSDEFIINVFDTKSLDCFFQSYLCLRRNFLVTSKPYEKPILFMFIAGAFATIAALGAIHISRDNTLFFGYQFISILMVIVDIPLFFLLMSYIGFGIMFNQNQDKVIGALSRLEEVIIELKGIKEHSYLTDADLSDRQKYLIRIIDRDNVKLEVLHGKVKDMITTLENVGKREVYKFLGTVECTKETVTKIRLLLTSLLTASVLKFINVIAQYW